MSARGPSGAGFAGRSGARDPVPDALGAGLIATGWAARSMQRGGRITATGQR